MSRRILVISDLHLGGAPNVDGGPGFQMCPEAGQRALSDFFGWASAEARAHGEGEFQLVLNGDIVDFLAETLDGQFSALTIDEGQALAKLESVFRTSRPVWPALGAYLATGASLTLLLGNHDVELSLPRVRRRLLHELGPGRVDFIYDNQALTFGPVLIEHGNRYDVWNSVFHNQLRELRSALSRGLPPTAVPLQPGSELVVKVMNPIKAQYAFVDLLKPERAGVLPLLAFLAPKQWLKVRGGIRALFRARLDWRTAAGEPRDRDQVAAPPTVAPEDERLFDLADDLAAGGDRDAVSGDEPQGFIERWRHAASAGTKQAQLAGLHHALRALVGAHQLTFEIDHEDAEYLVPANERNRSGFEWVVFGHTHLAKRTSLESGGHYLNTGTWADIMRVPDLVLENGPGSREALQEFAEALVKNDIERWRGRAPTFADIHMKGDTVSSADVFFFDGPHDVVPLTTEGLRKRVGR